MPSHKKLLDEAQEGVMLHLGLLNREVERLLKVLVREAPVVEVPGKTAKLKQYPPLTVSDLQYLDDEFIRLLSDASAARIRLHQVITLMRMADKKPSRR